MAPYFEIDIDTTGSVFADKPLGFRHLYGVKKIEVDAINLTEVTIRTSDISQDAVNDLKGFMEARGLTPKIREIQRRQDA